MSAVDPVEAVAEALDHHRYVGNEGCYCGKAGMSDYRTHKAQVAVAAARPAIEREAKAAALREAADEMAAVIADGDCAEVAAPVSGEVGRASVVARRDALYEEPDAWLRDRADRIEREGDDV